MQFDIQNWSREKSVQSWKTVTKVLDLNIPSNPAEAGLLLEILGDLAKNSEVESNADEIRLTRDKMVAIWHCCNMFVLNEWGNEGETSVCCDVLNLLAPKIDGTSIGLTLV